MKFKVGDRVKVNKSLPSINGMLREGTEVRIDYISNTPKHNFRVVDDLGKIWFLESTDLKYDS